MRSEQDSTNQSKVWGAMKENRGSRDCDTDQGGIQHLLCNILMYGNSAYADVLLCAVQCRPLATPSAPVFN